MNIKFRIVSVFVLSSAIAVMLWTRPVLGPVTPISSGADLFTSNTGRDHIEGSASGRQRVRVDPGHLSREVQPVDSLSVLLDLYNLHSSFLECSAELNGMYRSQGADGGAQDYPIQPNTMVYLCLFGETLPSR